MKKGIGRIVATLIVVAGLTGSAQAQHYRGHYGGGYHGHYGGGYGWGGFAAGAIIGGLLASQYYSPRAYYYPYYTPRYAYAGGAVAYCSQRFRSYDPYTGTYLGYDGYRHPCP